jgi:glycosyltransferase involved in cell wall biosynthesis
MPSPASQSNVLPGTVLVSFIVPAHNEQACLGRTLQAIHEAARTVGRPYEVIVVNDASTDATAAVARENDAIVLPVNHRHIAATRNSGGRAARGERLFFVDADTTINAPAVASALRYMDRGAVGGGGPVLFDGNVPLYVRLWAWAGVIAVKFAGFTGGAFMFCTRAAFQVTGGFDERFYWAEEGTFALRLKREGWFVVLWRPVLTSARRFRTLSGLKLPAFLIRTALSPFKAFTRREFAAKIWYDSNRENDDKVSTALVARVSNGFALLISIILITGPVWYLIPWSLTPWGTPLGIIRVAIGTFLCHVGLVFWPFAILIFVQLLHRRYWFEWIKMAALAAFLFWQAWDCTRGVIWFWTWLCHP